MAKKEKNMSQQETMMKTEKAQNKAVVRVDRKTTVAAIIASLRQLKENQVQYAKIELKRG